MKMEMRIGDVGTKVLLSTNVDLSTALVVQIICEAPSGTVTIWEAYPSFVTTVIEYIIQEGDITEIGTWTLQAKLVFAEGTWYSSFIPLKITPVIGALA